MRDDRYDSRESYANALPSWVDLLARYPHAPIGEIEEFDRRTGFSRKVVALARAGRADDIADFLDRLTAGSLDVVPIERDVARDKAQAYVRDLGAFDLGDACDEHAWGWAFFYQTVKFLETERFADMAVGHGPVLVDRYSGAVWPTGSAFNLETYVATGWTSEEAVPASLVRYDASDLGDGWIATYGTGQDIRFREQIAHELTAGHLLFAAEPEVVAVYRNKLAICWLPASETWALCRLTYREAGDPETSLHDSWAEVADAAPPLERRAFDWSSDS